MQGLTPDLEECQHTAKQSGMSGNSKTFDPNIISYSADSNNCLICWTAQLVYVMTRSEQEIVNSSDIQY